MAGEQLDLCGFCTSYGELVMAGAHFENYEDMGTHIALATSTDPAVIAKLQKHATRTAKEMKKMHGGEEAEPGGHEGHGH